MPEARHALAAQFEYVDSVTRFVELEHDWDDLQARSNSHIFQNHRFLRSWLETAAAHVKARPAVVLYREDGVVRAIFPGCVIRRMGLKNFTWLGGFHIVDYGDIMFDPSADLPQADFIDHAFDVFRRQLGFHACFLDNVRDDAQIHDYLSQRFQPYRHGVAPYISLDGSFSQYCDGLKVFRKKMKSDTLRQIRRLSALGALEFHVCGSDGHSRDEVVRTFVDQKGARLKEQDRSGAIELPGYSDLLITEASRNRSVHISYLTVNGVIIAVHYGYLSHNERFYYYMPSLEGEYGTYSPGRVLVYYLLERCFAQGLKVFDFTVGDEPYKYDWTRDEVSMTGFMRNDLPTKWVRYALPLRSPRAAATRLRARLSRE